MNHMSEEELIAYHDGERKGREGMTAHLKECAECRGELARLERMFDALKSIPVPDPGAEYGRRVWQQIAPRLPEKRESRWAGWFAWKPLAIAGAMAAVIMVAYWAGVKHGNGGGEMADAGKVRERVLVVAVGDHLGKSEMMLMELENAPTPERGAKAIDITATQRRAEDLVEANRLYRQTALKEGDQAMVSTLDELERVLLDIANSPDEVTPGQFEALRKRIEARGILFKVRVVNQDLREREKAGKPSPAQGSTGKKESNQI